MAQLSNTAIEARRMLADSITLDQIGSQAQGYEIATETELETVTWLVLQDLDMEQLIDANEIDFAECQRAVAENVHRVA